MQADPRPVETGAEGGGDGLGGPAALPDFC